MFCNPAADLGFEEYQAVSVMEGRLRIVVDDLRGQQIQALLKEHMRHMYELSSSPPYRCR